MRLGMNWWGMELEQGFVDVGSGYDCPGLQNKIGNVFMVAALV